LVKISAFFKDGKFDKNTYVNVLKQNRRTSKEFEAQLKQDLLIAKVQNIFNLPLSSNEIANIGQLIYSQDKVSISIIDAKNTTIRPALSELEEYWEGVKSNYKSPAGYEINYTKVDSIDGKTKKEMRKIALKLYLKLKRDEKKFADSKTIYNASDFLTGENFDKVIKSTSGETLKPIYENGNYYIVELVSKIAPKVLPFEKVKSEIGYAFIADAKDKILDTKTKDVMDNFKGVDIGYISRDKQPTVAGLTDDEIAQLTEKIFRSKNQLGSVKLLDKAVVYKITDSRFIPYNNENDNTIITSVSDIKTNLISSSLLAELKNRYEVQSFTGSK
ncbi:MAG: peptidylprolyl isomerase, partial [Campylobacterota bacterium]|nr:peptidylprolyl isomerase [Campylobacterota bacterium]